IRAPATHQRAHASRVSAQKVAHDHRQLVDVVPPRAADHELLQHRHVVGRETSATLLRAEQVCGRVPLLAPARPAPQLQDGLAPAGAVELDTFEHASGDGAYCIHPQPVERHRRFHVRLHAPCPVGVLGRGHLAPQLRDQGAAMYRAFTGTPSCTRMTHVEPLSKPPSPARTTCRETSSSTSSQTMSPCVQSTAWSSFESPTNSLRPSRPWPSASSVELLTASLRAWPSGSTVWVQRR